LEKFLSPSSGIPINYILLFYSNLSLLGEIIPQINCHIIAILFYIHNHFAIIWQLLGGSALPPLPPHAKLKIFFTDNFISKVSVKNNKII